MFSTILFFAQANGGRESNLMQTLIMIGFAVVFFYFILWRPERKRRKALEEKRGAMKTGDRVTVMGLVGTLDKVEDNTIILKTVDGSKIEVLKAAITEVEASGSTTVEDKPQ